MEITIDYYRNGEEIEISKLIRKVYDEFVAPDYSDEGNNFFYNWILPENIAERQENKRQLWTARYGGKIVGIIEMRDNTYVSLLFVDKKYHGNGIAKMLLKELIKESLKRDAYNKKIFVHASPYSIDIYMKLGFKSTGDLKIENGILYLPMEKMI